MKRTHAPKTSHLESFGYGPRSHILQVKFKGARKLYAYPDVAPSVFAALKKSAHPGHVLFEKVISKL